MLFNQPIDDIISRRISIRSYLDEPLNPAKATILREFIPQIPAGPDRRKINYLLIEKRGEDFKKARLGDYGLMKNPRHFFAGVIRSTPLAFESYGYQMEHLVLKATELNLGTCWLGYFNPEVFEEIIPDESSFIPSVVVLGDPASRAAIIEKVARLYVRARKRKSWRELFFHDVFSQSLSKEVAGKYAEPLQLLQLAPSAGNTQPWRILWDEKGGIFHFYKAVVSKSYEKKRLHNIDLGIAMCHFELGCKKNNLAGSWQNLPPNQNMTAENLQYIISWQGNKKI